jgi:hypothetical protein
MFIYFFIKMCFVYEITPKNIVDRHKVHDYIIQHMRFACCYIRQCTQFTYILLLFHVTIYTQMNHTIIAVSTLPDLFSVCLCKLCF